MGNLDHIIAVDVGGTFTDLLAFDERDGRLVAKKVLTSYPNPFEAVADALRASQVPISSLTSFRHGTTIGINALIEGTAPPAGMLCTSGFRDALEQRRGSRSDAYDLFWHPLPPLVPRNQRWELSERMDSAGIAVSAVDGDEVAAIARELARFGVRSVGVCLINSYVNPAHEERVGDLLRRASPDLHVSLSSELTRQLGEYERSSTVAVNARLRPILYEYLDELEVFLRGQGFEGSAYVMQSNGGVTSFAQARMHPCLTIESGPVAGVVAAAEVSKATGLDKIVSFDMGGTTAKACVVESGVPQITDLYEVGGGRGYAVRIPGADIVEVGAGGGSIASVDATGALRVGPRSAGSAPGPACYGRGGQELTVTDANLLLGRINPGYFADGAFDLDVSAATAAAERVAQAVDLSVPELASGVVQIADVIMAGAVRQVTVERGLDPRDFAIVAYGGAGPLHACDIARQLHCPTVIVPVHPGHTSALGMLLSTLRRDYVRTELLSTDSPEFVVRLREVLDQMEAEAAKVLEEEGLTPEIRYAVDMRYAGQHYDVTVPLPRELSAEQVLAAFEDTFDQRFGHRFHAGVPEIVNVRVTAIAASGSVRLDRLARHGRDLPAAVPTYRPVYWAERDTYTECPVYAREALPPGTSLRGPAIVEEAASNTFIGHDDEMVVDPQLSLVISIGASGESDPDQLTEPRT